MWYFYAKLVQKFWGMYPTSCWVKTVLKRKAASADSTNKSIVPQQQLVGDNIVCPTLWMSILRKETYMNMTWKRVSWYFYFFVYLFLWGGCDAEVSVDPWSESHRFDSRLTRPCVELSLGILYKAPWPFQEGSKMKYKFKPYTVLPVLLTSAPILLGWQNLIQLIKTWLRYLTSLFQMFTYSELSQTVLTFFPNSEMQFCLCG